MSDQIIARVSQSLASEHSLESLVRQLLEMLEMVTDMESTYLTKVDIDARLHHFLSARNSQKMHIPENFTVSWDYSLCKRAIDENCFFSDEVPDRWGDCIAARNLGITTFLSTPIHLPDGSFYGTLCAASSEKRFPSSAAVKPISLSLMSGRSIFTPCLPHSEIYSMSLPVYSVKADISAAIYSL